MRRQLEQDLYEVQIRLNELVQASGKDLPPNVTPLSPQSTNFFPVPVVNSPSAVNQLRNGEYGHSVNTWFEIVAAPASDQGFECALWFSNSEPVNGQALSAENSITDPGVDNSTLKAAGHPFYDPEYSDWDRSNGWARFQGTTSIDAPMPTNTKAGLTQFFGGLLALNNEDYPTVTYHMPADTMIRGGLWDNTAGQLDWLPGIFDFTFSAIQGTPSGSTERRYKIFARTDRDYTFLSDELVIANAPDDASFATSSVYMTWRAVPGILEYDVYRHDITAGEFQLLNSIGNGSTAYSDDGHILKGDVGSYPTPTNAVPIAFVSTYPGDLDFVPVNGTADWIQLWLNIAIPQTYDMSQTTDAQWIRLYLSNALDRSVSDVVTTSADTTMTSAIGSFTALDAGRTVRLTDGENVLDTAINTYTNATTVELDDPWPYPNATDVTMYITGGGDHGLLMDLVHSSFVGRAAFAPNPEDLNRALQPQSSPTGSTQGGPGGGGSPEPGDGGVGCVPLDTPVMMWLGERLKSIPLIRLLTGDGMFSGGLYVNSVQNVRILWADRLLRIRTENAIELYCTLKHPLIRTRTDSRGQMASKFREGDFVLTSINGKVERSRIVSIAEVTGKVQVGTPILNGTHWYFAGHRYPKNPYVRLRRFVLKLLRKPDVVGIGSHNIKIESGQV